VFIGSGSCVGLNSCVAASGNTTIRENAKAVVLIAAVVSLATL
jgi:hypothetical protein